MCICKQKKIFTSVDFFTKRIFCDLFFWANKSSGNLTKQNLSKKIQIVLTKVLPTSWKNTTFGETHLNINDGIKHDWRKSRFNRLESITQNPLYGTFLITSRFEICVTSQLRKYLLYSKIPRFKLESNNPRLEMRISQWKT